MRIIILFFALILISHQQTLAQKDSLPVNRVLRTAISYKSYVIVKNDLFALNDSGKLVIWDLNKLDTIHFAHSTSLTNYTAIAKDRFDNVFLGTSKGEIFKIIPGNLTYTRYLKTKYTIKYIFFNSSNNLFLIVRSAIYDPYTKQYWDKFENHTTGLIATRKTFIFFHKKVTKYFAMPQYSFLDSEDKLWMTAAYGEFGGELEIFDTQNKAIINNKFSELNPGSLSPRSVFEDNEKNIYITCGLQHMMNFGEIYRIDKNRTVTKIFDGITNPDNEKKNLSDSRRDFVGPGAYNKVDKKIYFATATGFYKADPSGDKIKPEFLFNTQFTWSREPLAIGVNMSIVKLDFTTDNKLLFLTQNDGFGVYDGKRLTMLK